MTARSRSPMEWAGLAAGPGAWAISTQANYAFAPWACGYRAVVPILAAVLVAVALGGAALSWREWRARGEAPGLMSEGPQGRPRTFMAAASTLIAILFATIILMQGVAGLILQGCER